MQESLQTAPWGAVMDWYGFKEKVTFLQWINEKNVPFKHKRKFFSNWTYQ